MPAGLSPPLSCAAQQDVRRRMWHVVIFALAGYLCATSMNAIAAVRQQHGEIKQFLLESTRGNMAAAEIVSTDADINGDGRADWTGIVIGPPQQRTQQRRATIYVLVQDSSAGYRIDGR